MTMCQDLEMLICLFEGRQDDGALEDLWIGNCLQVLEALASMVHEDMLGDTWNSWGHMEAGCMVTLLELEAVEF